MLQIIGLIVAVYAMARLLQVPIEHGALEQRGRRLWFITVLAVGAIGFLTLMLLVSGVSMPQGVR